MSTDRKRYRLSLERLEERLALSTGHAVHSVATPPPGDTLAVLSRFTKTYPSRVGDPRYNPAYDLNHNGQVGQTDGRLLLRELPPLSPKIPLTLTLTLAPQDQAKGPVPQNSGGVTHSQTPTILGHTTPGALVFTGEGTVDLRLKGPAVVADANGNFAFKDVLTDGINQLDFQVVTPYGQQLLRAYPIRWLGFGAFEAAHPRKT